MMRRFFPLALLATALVLAGCHAKPPVQSSSGNSAVPANGAGASSAGANGASANAGAGAAGEDAAGPQEGVLARRIIYFDFDSSEIHPEGAEIIAGHAKYLTAHSAMRVRLEGHTDERGSREYNIGLGERRAQAVRRAMLLQGVSDAQIATVSYGAERPAVAGSDEAAWSKNRRVEIVYLK